MNSENLKNNSDYNSLDSEDTKLRQSINTLARRESTLLDVGGAAEIQKEIQNRVMVGSKSKRQIIGRTEWSKTVSNGYRDARLI